MNSIKAFFNWIGSHFLVSYAVYWDTKSTQLSFVAKNCKDHHPAWEFLLVFFFGLLRELIVLCVRALLQKRKDGDLSVEDFLSFSSEMKSCFKYIYIYSQITSYTFVIINFHLVLLRNNLKLAQSAVYKLNEDFTHSVRWLRMGEDFTHSVSWLRYIFLLKCLQFTRMSSLYMRYIFSSLFLEIHQRVKAGIFSFKISIRAFKVCPKSH